MRGIFQGFSLLASFILVYGLPDACPWKKNFTENPEFITKEYVKQIGDLEDCLYYYLIDKEYEKSNEFNSLIHRAPPTDGDEKTGRVLRVEIEDILIHRVQLKPQSTYQFRIEGDIYLNWLDTRLTWDLSEWHIEQFTLHDTHHIWSPKLKDFGRCADDPLACITTLADVDLLSDGRVYARLHFSYDSYCSVDYSRYPEEENNCCVFFSGFEQEVTLAFDVLPKTNHEMEHAVGAAPPATRHLIDSVYAMEEDHTAWVVDSRTITSHSVIVPIPKSEMRNTGVVKVAPFAALEMLRVCVHAEKKMSTVAFALRLPVTIATLIMLVSPLFGELKTQAWVKLLTLCLQTACFLFLVSIAPPNGFAGAKPKIYVFYEFLFTITFLSILVTVSMMAVSRVKRTVPPTHRVYLFAKVINRLICCIEPEPGASYQRHLDESEGRGGNLASNDPEYTQDWRHIYLAINNLKRMDAQPSIRRAPLPYVRLPARLQHLVNCKLSFGARVQLRATSKVFSKRPGDVFLLVGQYRFVRLFIKGLQCHCAFSFYIEEMPDPTLQPSDFINISIGVSERDESYAIDCGFRQRSPDDVGPYFIETTTTAYNRPKVLRFESTISMDERRALRILDKLTSSLPSQAVCLQHMLLGRPLPAITKMSFFRRCPITIAAQFGALWAGRHHDRYLRLDEWIPNGLRPYQASIWPTGYYAPDDYLPILMDAFEKLKDLPLLHLNQVYRVKADCLESLAVIEQMIHHIVKSPPPSGQRRLVAFHTLLFRRYLPPEEERSEYLCAREKMLERLIESFNNCQSHFNTQVQLYVEGGRGRRMFKGAPPCVRTGIRIILAQNYSLPHSKQLIHLSPWLLSDTCAERLTGPKEGIALRWDSSATRDSI
ncbi:unnamed protein product, partial [Mesorhabditis spiculigera]